MLDEHQWPEGYHVDNNFQCAGPEAPPGNMRAICELMDSLKDQCQLLRDRVSALEDNQ